MRFSWLVAAALLAHTAVAHAHIAMTSPRPRSAGQKTGPCGDAGSMRGQNITTYRPGETITLEWDETVGHPGHYRIAFDDDGNDVFTNPRQPDDNFPSTLVDQIVDRDGTSHYTQQVTLPNMTCTNCTLQLMQVMTTSVPYNSFYYQCADIVLAAESDADPEPPVTDGGCAAGGSASGLAAGLAVRGSCCAGGGAARKRRRVHCPPPFADTVFAQFAQDLRGPQRRRF